MLSRLALGALAALGLHYGLFIHGEWHLHSPVIFILHVFAFFSYVAFLYVSEKCGIEPSLVEAVLVFSAYLTTLLSSIAVYRFYFHRLSRAGFPGPPLARITKIWHAWACRDSKSFLVLHDLTRKYGDFVRTGEKATTISSSPGRRRVLFELMSLRRAERAHNHPSGCLSGYRWAWERMRESGLVRYHAPQHLAGHGS
ncbi:MAG: hypothetical protein Q9193_001503 [Seirophora villosa]